MNLKYYINQLLYFLKIKKRIYIGDKISVTYTDISGNKYTNTEYYSMKGVAEDFKSEVSQETLDNIFKTKEGE